MEDATLLHKTILRFIEKKGEEGAIAAEIYRELRMKRNTVSPRLSELLRLGYLKRTGVKRTDLVSGRSSFVLVCAVPTTASRQRRLKLREE